VEWPLDGSGRQIGQNVEALAGVAADKPAVIGLVRIHLILKQFPREPLGEAASPAAGAAGCPEILRRRIVFLLALDRHHSARHFLCLKESEE